MAAPGHIILRVHNVDTQVHNLNIDGTKTPDLQPEATTELDLGELAVGNYEMYCLIPGHKDAGMSGTLMVTADGATAPETPLVLLPLPPAEGCAAPQ